MVVRTDNADKSEGGVEIAVTRDASLNETVFSVADSSEKALDRRVFVFHTEDYARRAGLCIRVYGVLPISLHSPFLSPSALDTSAFTTFINLSRLICAGLSRTGPQPFILGLGDSSFRRRTFVFSCLTLLMPKLH
jgi:hypothetical protein